ncbi:MAG: hypothetical protein IPJ77_05555 [Planctomycetes bacterium]|nr:hypothetical protein [Planctomycetota bacterium]
MPKVQRALDETALRGERAIDHAFVRGLELGGALIAAAGIVAWLVMRMGRTRGTV